MGLAGDRLRMPGGGRRDHARGLVARLGRDQRGFLCGARLGQRDLARPRKRRRGDRRKAATGPRSRSGAPTSSHWAPRDEPAQRHGRRAAHPLALPRDGAARLLGPLPRRGARQRAGRGAHDSRHRPLLGLPRLGDVRTRPPATSGSTASAASRWWRAATPGSIVADAACAPQGLELRSSSGDVRAVVPAGRYRVDADSASGEAVVRGIDLGAGRAVQPRRLLELGRRDRGGGPVSGGCSSTSASCAPRRRSRTSR